MKRLSLEITKPQGAPLRRVTSNRDVLKGDPPKQEEPAKKVVPKKEPVKKEAPKKEYPARKEGKTYTAEEIKAKLVNYREVSPENYKYLTTNDTVRYVNKDGKFRLGGHIIRISEKDGKPYFVLTPSRYSRSATKEWVLYWHKIAKLWKQSDMETELIAKDLGEKKGRLDRIEAFLFRKFPEYKEYVQEWNKNKKN